MFQLPVLSKKYCRFLSVCIHKELDTKADLRELSPDLIVCKKVGDSDGEDIYAQELITTRGHHRHYHFEIGLESAIPIMEKKRSAKKTYTLPKELADTEPFATVWGNYCISKSKISEKTVIKILNDVSLRFLDFELIINGCSLENTGEGPLKILRWLPASESEIVLEICAYRELKIDDQVFVNAAAFLEEYVQQLTIEKKPRKRIKSDGK